MLTGDLIQIYEGMEIPADGLIIAVKFFKIYPSIKIIKLINKSLVNYQQMNQL